MVVKIFNIKINYVKLLVGRMPWPSTSNNEKINNIGDHRFSDPETVQLTSKLIYK